MTWLDQINRHEIVLPSGITRAVNGRIPDELLVDVHDGNGRRIGKLSRPAARSFKAMVRQALADGVPPAEITATDTYRRIETQQRLWDERYAQTDQGNGSKTCSGDTRYLKDGMATAACPGTSNHGYAGAIDKGNGPAWHAWLEANAGRYGWEWELRSEKWHLHYWPGDDIPQAVLDSETDNDDLTEAEMGEIKAMLESIAKQVQSVGAIASVNNRLLSEIHPDADATAKGLEEIKGLIAKIDAGEGASVEELLDGLYGRLKG